MRVILFRMDSDDSSPPRKKVGGVQRNSLTSISRGRAQRQEEAVDRRRRRSEGGREEEGVGNSTASPPPPPPPPVPSSVVMAECRPGQARPGTDLLGMLLAAGVSPATPPPSLSTPQQTHGSSSQTEEGENGNVWGGDESLFLR